MYVHLYTKATDRPTYEYTGWRRPIGCLKVQVFFHFRATNYRALLPKMTFKEKASYGSSPPVCMYAFMYIHIYIYIYIY